MLYKNYSIGLKKTKVLVFGWKIPSYRIPLAEKLSLKATNMKVCAKTRKSYNICVYFMFFHAWVESDNTYYHVLLITEQMVLQKDGN